MPESSAEFLESTSAFWSSLSAGLKVLVFFLIWIGAWLPIALPTAFLLKWRPGQPLAFSQKLSLLASLYGVAPLVLWGIAALEGCTFADYGLPWQLSVLRSLTLGLGIGAIGLVAVLILQGYCGWLKGQFPAKTATTIGSTLLLSLWVSGTEELIFRGFLLTQLQQDYGSWTAGILTSLIFASLHLVWEGRETIPQLPGLALMGGVLVLARWADAGNLGLAWGLHAGWVWVIASSDTLQAIQYKGRVAEWVTGIGGKPLAGAIGVLFMLLMAALLGLYLLEI